MPVEDADDEPAPSSPPSSVAEWLRGYPYIFTKTSRLFRDTQKKTALWQQKAQELGVSYPGLMTWYESIRTKIGKLTKTKSGQPAGQPTDRDKFILQNFQFLAEHIVRMPSRTAQSLVQKVAASASQSVAPVDSSDAESQAETQPQPGPSQPQPQPQPRPGERASKGKGKASARTATQDMLSTLRTQQDNARLQSQIRGILEPVRMSPQAMWGSWLGSMAETLHNDLAQRFYVESFQHMMEHMMGSWMSHGG